MPVIDLTMIRVSENSPRSDYYIGAVVNSSSGPRGVKIISNQRDLDNYFPDLKYREGYGMLLNSGASLVLKRLESSKSRVSTLRLTSNPNIRYVYPEVYDSIEFFPKDDSSFYSVILMDQINDGAPIKGPDLIESNYTKVKGSIGGDFNTNDSIKCTVNEVEYQTQIDNLGNFEFSILNFNILYSKYKRLSLELITWNGDKFEAVKHLSKYSIEGLPDINIELEPINAENVIGIDTETDFTSLITLKGLVYGDFLSGSTVYLKIGTEEFETQCSMNGTFQISLPISKFKDNKFVSAEVKFPFNGNEYYAETSFNYFIDYVDIDVESLPEHMSAYKDIQTTVNKTLVYDIDFGTSSLNDEDFIIIPRSDVVNWDSNVMIYYVSSLTPFKTPDDFQMKVTLESVSTPQFKFIIPEDEAEKEIMRLNRAKYLFDLFTGEINGADMGVIKDMCELDEINNRVKLVFSTPVSNISYSSSNDLNSPFTVKSNEKESNSMLVRLARDQSIISFSTLVQGDLEVQLTLKHIENFKFYLTEKVDNNSTTYMISLDEYDVDYNKENIFVENVLNGNSEFLKCIVHSLPSDPKSLEGEYLVTKGSKGVDINSNLDNYKKSLDYVFESGLDINLFLTDVFFEKEYLDILKSKLLMNEVVGVTMIPDEVLIYEEMSEFHSNIDQFLIEDKNREFLIYSFGEVKLNAKRFMPAYFYQVKDLVNGKFLGIIKDNIIASQLRPEECDYLDSKFVNYLEESNSLYNVTDLVNIPTFLNPTYLLISTYVKQLLTRFLRSRIGTYSMGIYFELNLFLSDIRRYNSLIKSIKIDKYEVKENFLIVKFELELTGLVGTVLSINITLNINN